MEILEAFAVALAAALVKQIPTEPNLPAYIEQALADFKIANPQIGASPPDPEQPAIDAEIDADLKK